MSVDLGKIQEMLGSEADSLLNHVSHTIPKENIHVPGGDFVDRIWMNSDRNPNVLRSLQTLNDHGRLSGTGYLSILPVDQGIEHSAGASFAPNPMYFDPGNIVKLAIEGGCNAVASTFGVLGSVARKYVLFSCFCNCEITIIATFISYFNLYLFQIKELIDQIYKQIYFDTDMMKKKYHKKVFSEIE